MTNPTPGHRVARQRWAEHLLAGGLLLAALAAPPLAAAELILPPGFTATVYVSGEGFEAGSGRGGTGIPSTSTLAVDDSGHLYLARTGRRYGAAEEAYDLWRLYRIPPGGARLGPDNEERYFYGPPLRNPQVAGVLAGREVLVTTFDRERRIGVLYRLRDGRAQLLAGGTPEPGALPLLRQPEGAAVDTSGYLYVADREQGAVLRLDPQGRVDNERFVSVPRPRLLVVDDQDHLWIATDGNANMPWQRGPGEIWRVDPGGTARLVLYGPRATGLWPGPAGTLLVADRQASEIFLLTPDGQQRPFARFTDNDAPRGLVIAPDTPDTRRAGIAGDLFLVQLRRGAWPLNEVVRISGPFGTLLEGERPATR